METQMDILDMQGNLTGKTATKAEIHLQGYWHRSAHIWIYDAKGNILLQLRAKDKDSSPGLWDISAAGHVDTGETPEQAAVREIAEELGIIVAEADLRKAWERTESTFDPANGWTNNQISSEYIFCYTGDKSLIKYQPEEIDDIKWISMENFRKGLSDPGQRQKYVSHGEGYYERILAEIVKTIQ